LISQNLLPSLKSLENSARRDFTELVPHALLLLPLGVFIIGENKRARFDVEPFLVCDKASGNLLIS
jgi:hypothetical protein